MAQNIENMEATEHFKLINDYYLKSEWEYDFFLNGSKHFGYYPNEDWTPIGESQQNMQNLVATKIGLKAGMRILDAGCGQGVTSTYLAKKFSCFIEGVTVVPFEIIKSERLAANMNVSEKVRYSLMDYSHLEFPHESFDAVYTQESLVHSLNIKKTLSELYRVLKPGGRIALFEYTMAEDSKFSLEELRIMREMNEGSEMRGLPAMRHDSFSRLMEEVGFLDVTAEDITKKVAPMIRRYQFLTKPAFHLVNMLGLTRRTPNLIAVACMDSFGKKDLVRYNIFNAIR